MRFTILLFWLSLFTCEPCFAQSQRIERFNTFNYSVNEGLLQSTIGDIAYDKNNFCWISFPNGIQKFDGREFTIVPIQAGLPDDKFVRYLRCSNGDLLISHSQGISKYEISGNRFIQVYTYPASKKVAQFIGEDEQIVYFYTVEGNITGINLRGFTVNSNTKTGLPDHSSNTDFRPAISSNIIDHKVTIGIKDMLYCWDLKKKQLITQSAPIQSISPYLLRMWSAHEALYYDYITNNALQLYDFNTNTSRTIILKGKDNQAIGRCNILLWQNKNLISFNERLYEFDIANFTLGPELVNYQNDPVGGRATIAKLAEDNFGNLCLSTVTSGIKKIIKNNYPVRYYGTLKKDDNNNILSILPDKKSNRILAGTTGNGLLVFDTLQRLVKHIRTIPGDTLPKSFNCIVKDNKGNYLLFCNSDDKIWILSADLLRLSQLPASSISGKNINIDYFGNTVYQDEKIAITQAQGKLYKTNFIDNTCTEYEFTTSYTMGGLYYNGTIISHTNDELFFIDAETFREKKRMPFKNTGYVRCFAREAAGNIYMGSNKGIFKIDPEGKILAHLTKANGLPDECIYAIAVDEQGALWCSSNKGIFKVKADNSILQLKKEDGLQENEFNTNVVAKAENGELFFGGVNGVSSFYPSAISSFEEKINLLVTRIRINNEEAFTDTAVWDINKIKLPYDRNSLSFDFVAMSGNNPGQYIYQYKMDGIDKQWIQNDGLQTVRYLLPPGTYTLKIYASRFFDKDARPMKTIQITINPPFWKTWWFITAMIILFVAGLVYSINRYNKNKYQKKLVQLENERKLQQERENISRNLHDSIGAYANAVLYKTELLQNEADIAERKELMNDLKFASKDIITSLRETVWALKKENYTAEECLLRIKNFMQALSRYYPHVQFKAVGEAPVGKILHHNKSLHIVRIVQEAVTNAIKHAVATNISLSSDQSEGRWQLTVVDDGKGFDYEAMKHTEEGNGLLNMQQRATESDIIFTIVSKMDSGTKVTILI
jgi:signal transduction histidine kinase/ligand-binding sensor domain-containing protein